MIEVMPVGPAGSCLTGGSVHGDPRDVTPLNGGTWNYVGVCPVCRQTIIWTPHRLWEVPPLIHEPWVAPG